MTEFLFWVGVLIATCSIISLAVGAVLLAASLIADMRLARGRAQVDELERLWEMSR